MLATYSGVQYSTTQYLTLSLVPDGVDLWDLSKVAEYLGVQTGTVRSYLARGQMPPPDLRLGGSPLWYAETIKKWHASRPSQQRDG